MPPRTPRFDAVRRWATVVVSAAALTACATYAYRPAPLASFHAGAAPAPVADARAELGRALFFDVRLSGANDTACASCHQPARGFEDGRAVAVGTGGRIGAMATPTLIGVGESRRLMWDGRVRSLEAQALMPVANPLEMDQDPVALAAELAADPAMRAAFARAFPADPAVTTANIARALAAYQRTIRPERTRFDRFAGGDTAALSESERRGFALFNGSAGCARCHSGALLSDGRLHDIGLADRGNGTRFKTPTLRHLATRAPYMHDGSLPTLAAVVDHYADRSIPRRGVPARTPLTARERRDLVAFLETLSPDAVQTAAR